MTSDALPSTFEDKRDLVQTTPSSVSRLQHSPPLAILCARWHVAPAPDRASHIPQNTTITPVSNHGSIHTLVFPLLTTLWRYTSTLRTQLRSCSSPPPHTDRATPPPSSRVLTTAGLYASSKVNAGTSSIPNPQIVLVKAFFAVRAVL